jgi:N-methylhydantoinase B
MAQIDPITLATTWHFLQQVCRDMRQTMERTATNSLATSLHDLAYGIWDAQARVIAIPEGFPCRLISSTYPIKAVMKTFDKQIYEGDVFLTNHPYKAGAVHLPDWVFVRPIFYKGELVFFSCMGTHVPDNGGAQPGTHYLANDSVAEGLNIPPVKLMEKGKMREDVLDLILSNNRLPEMMRREIRSLIGSTSVAERSLIELLDKYGKDMVFNCIEEMINRTEKAVRAQVAKWPDGTYYSEAKTDDDGTGTEIPVTVRCKLTIKGGESTFDFSDSDEQVKGCINAVYSMTLSDTLCTVFLFLGTELSSYHNEGSLKPFHIIAREGTVVNAKPGALTAQTPGVTGGLVIEAVVSALSQALPDHAIASYARQAGFGQRVGVDPRTNQLYVYTTFCALGGAGAVSGYDGYQCCCDIGTLGVVSKADIEEDMIRYPWRITKYEYRTDSAGPGKWRGAPGIQFESFNEGADGVVIGGTCSGWIVQGQGQQGGYPTPFNKFFFRRGNEVIDVVHPRSVHKVKTGDTTVSIGGGGAGVGLPEERDPEAVKVDVRNEIVSLEAARNIYKVVLDPDSFEIDYKETQKVRARR